MHETDIRPTNEVVKACELDAQAVPLFKATTFVAVHLALGRQSTGMPSHAETSLIQSIEIPCQTLEQQRRAEMYVRTAAAWVLFTSKSIYKLKYFKNTSIYSFDHFSEMPHGITHSRSLAYFLAK